MNTKINRTEGDDQIVADVRNTYDLASEVDEEVLAWVAAERYAPVGARNARTAKLAETYDRFLAANR
jgi:hypothetical protein